MTPISVAHNAIKCSLYDYLPDRITTEECLVGFDLGWQTGVILGESPLVSACPPGETELHP